MSVAELELSLWQLPQPYMLAVEQAAFMGEAMLQAMAPALLDHDLHPNTRTLEQPNPDWIPIPRGASGLEYTRGAARPGLPEVKPEL